jgi:glyoxylase-like metal-dependent hydrolase (beta-lactamase superfamily II)
VTEKNGVDASRADALKDVTAIAMDAPSTLDLGGVTARFIPRHGHTASDVSIELDNPSIVFCGDLVWNAMVPNYVDAVPSRLSAAVRALRRKQPTLYVPGHGALAREAEFDNYVIVIDESRRPPGPAVRPARRPLRSRRGSSSRKRSGSGPSSARSTSSGQLAHGIRRWVADRRFWLKPV